MERINVAVKNPLQFGMPGISLDGEKPRRPPLDQPFPGNHDGDRRRAVPDEPISGLHHRHVGFHGIPRLTDDVTVEIVGAEQISEILSHVIVVGGNAEVPRLGRHGDPQNLIEDDTSRREFFW